MIKNTLPQFASTWNVTKIKRLLSVPITDGPHTTPDLIESGVPFISAESIQRDGTIDFNKRRGNISVEDHNAFKKKAFPKINDIFMVKSGATTGRVAQVLNIDFEFSIWSPLALFRAKPNLLHPRFLFYVLSSEYLKKQVELSWSFGTQQNIGMGVLGNLFIGYPTFKEQEKIANYLDKKCEQIDKAIAKKKELIEKLNEKQNIILNKTLAKGLLSSMEFKETGIQWYKIIPQHWKMIKGKYIYKILSGYAFKSEFFYGAEENYPKLVTPGSFNPDGGLYFTERGTTTYSGEYHQSFLLKKNDLLVVMTDLSYKKLILGRFEYVEQDNLLLNQRIGKIIFNKQGMNEIMPDYLQELMNSDIIRDQVKLSSTGATVFHSSPDKIRSIPLPIPPLNEQKEILEHLKVEKERSRTAISKIQTEIDLLEEYKTALISESVTGKIDLIKMK